MILRIDKIEYDGKRVPLLIHWKNQKVKQAFVREVVAISAFKPFSPLKGFSNVKVEAGVFKPTANVEIKFKDREEKSDFLKHLHDLGDDCNMYVACPDDIPYNIITKWVQSSLPAMGIKPSTPLVITD